MLREERMEEFETVEDEPWYDQRDLEQDLHLAAELGKTLLERNKELEDALQAMYINNEEQVQEIEYLSKQVEMLRDMNEQHAKVYEQLDVTARELEITNEKLVLESKASQQKIDRLTGTMETLQSQVESLTGRVQELRSLEELRVRREKKERRKTVSSFPCLKELCTAPRYEDGFLVASAGDVCVPERRPLEQENDRLRAAMTSLRALLGAERGRREEAERECSAVVAEFQRLEQRLLGAEGCALRVQELEAELREMQALRKSRLCLTGISSSFEGEEPLEHTLLNHAPETDTPVDAIGTATAAAGSQAEGAETSGGGGGDSGGVPVRKSCSDTALSAISSRDACGRPRGSYALHANGVRRRGMSILREVDEQYHALLEKYEELLAKCRRHDDDLCHAEVQTSRPVSRDPSMRHCCPPAVTATTTTDDASATTATATASTNAHVPTTTHSPPHTPSTPEALEGISRQVEAVDKRLGRDTPEYKTLFKEIFSRLQKTKGDINTAGGTSRGRKASK